MSIFTLNHTLSFEIHAQNLIVVILFWPKTTVFPVQWWSANSSLKFFFLSIFWFPVLCSDKHKGRALHLPPKQIIENYGGYITLP